MLHDHRDGIVRVDADERVRREAGLVLRARGKSHGKDQRARGFEELAPADVLDHASFFAARLMAARMRGYVAQRQMLPLIAASICASLGSLLAERSATALITCPDWQ